MKAPAILLLAAAVHSAHGHVLDRRAGCTANSCAAAVSGTGPKSDCDNFLRTTVLVGAKKNVPTVTVTNTNAAVTSTIGSSLPATIIPTAVPSYASACGGTTAYSSACSCLGAAHSTTTVSVSTVTITVPQLATATHSFSSLPPYTSVTGQPPTGASVPTQTARAIPTNSNSTVDSINPDVQKTVLYGSKNPDNTYFFTQVGLTAKDGDTLVNVDDFQAFIADMTCSATSLSITFSSAPAFNNAKQNWPAKFTLMTSGSSYCGAGSKHSFYKVSKAVFTSPASVTLTVTSAALTDVIDSIDGQLGTLNAPSSNQKRDFWTDLATTLHNALTHDVSASKSTTINIDENFFASGHFAQDITLPYGTSAQVDSDIYCPGCGLQATIILSASFSCSLNNGCSQLGIELDINNAKIVALFDVSVNNVFEYDYEGVIVEEPILPIEVGDILTLDLSAQLVAGIGINVVGAWEVDNLGFTASMPDSSIALDLASGTATKTGFTPSWQLGDPVFQFQPPNMDFTAYVAPKLFAALDFAGKLNYEADVTFKTPDVSLSLSDYDSHNDCGSGNGHGGYQLGLEAGLDLTAGLSGKGIPDSWGEIDIWSSPRFNIIPGLFPQASCLPLP